MTVVVLVGEDTSSLDVKMGLHRVSIVELTPVHASHHDVCPVCDLIAEQLCSEKSIQTMQVESPYPSGRMIADGALSGAIRFTHTGMDREESSEQRGSQQRVSQGDFVKGSQPCVCFSDDSITAGKKRRGPRDKNLIKRVRETKV